MDKPDSCPAIAGAAAPIGGGAGDWADDMRSGMFRRTFACAFALLAAMAVAAAGGAWRPAHAATVKNIVIEGNRGIDDETIRARLGIPIGRNLSREDADRAVKTLFETG